jgi:hypothetical protein
MDVLKEIQLAETQAREIERAGAENMAALAAATTAELARIAAERSASLERDLAGLKETLERDLEREKTAAADHARAEIASIAARAAGNRAAAQALILAKAGIGV